MERKKGEMVGMRGNEVCVGGFRREENGGNGMFGFWLGRKK